MAVMLSAPRTSRTLLPRNIIFFLVVFGTHFCQRLSKPQGLVRPKGLSLLFIIKFIALFLDLEYGDDILFLQNYGCLTVDYAPLYTRT
jgi:hypothetical protein